MLDDALAQPVRAELIYRRGTPPAAEYTFKHALLQDAAYSALLRDRRWRLHAGIAATLEDQYREERSARTSPRSTGRERSRRNPGSYAPRPAMRS
jgi:predicted ATPase